MAVATFTTSAIYGLWPGSAHRGPKLWAGVISSDTDDTLDTGMDKVDAMSFTAVDAAVDAATHLYAVSSVAAGVITIEQGAIDDYADDTGQVSHVVVIGKMR